jgi:hypothetical protein
MVTVWTVVMVLACMAMVGLVLDGGAILRARSTTFDLASGAGRAAAQQLDQQALAEGHIRIDPTLARAAVDRYLARDHVTGVATVSRNQVTVTVHNTVTLQILRHTTIAVDQTATVTATEPGGP